MKTPTVALLLLALFVGSMARSFEVFDDSEEGVGFNGDIDSFEDNVPRFRSSGHSDERKEDSGDSHDSEDKSDDSRDSSGRSSGSSEEHKPRSTRRPIIINNHIRNRRQGGDSYSWW